MSESPIPPAEALEARRLALQSELGEPITLDGLTGTYRIFQRKRGHRHSIDDVLTAWYALEKSMGAERTLDLGTGIGTVGLMVLSRLSETARLTCIEAQEVSYRFLRENLWANGVASRVDALAGDLRDLSLGITFPLITGSPPYFDKRAGIVPADSQKAHARFELRGDVRDYVRIARSHLAEDGVFVFCFPYAQKKRALTAIRDGDLGLVSSRDVVPREGLAPLFSLFACKLGSQPGALETPFVVRDAEGRPTGAIEAVRASFGWPIGQTREGDAATRD